MPASSLDSELYLGERGENKKGEEMWEVEWRGVEWRGVEWKRVEYAMGLDTDFNFIYLPVY